MPRQLTLWGLLLVLYSPALFAADPPAVPTEPAQPQSRLEPFRQLRRNLPAGGAVDTSQLKPLTWKVGSDTRTALVYFPPQTDTLTPVVFAFHGHGGKPEHLIRRLALHTEWPQAIVVYPQGLPTAVPVIDEKGERAGWQKFIGDQADRDLQLFDTMLKDLVTNHRADPARVYVTGHSNGAYFTYVLWAARADKLTAVAPIAGMLSVRDMPTAPKPALHIAGESDPIVRYRGQARTMEKIRKLNHCDPVGKPAGAQCTEYTSKSGPPVVTFIHPGGHEIPEGAPKRIAEFFKNIDQAKK